MVGFFGFWLGFLRRVYIVLYIVRIGRGDVIIFRLVELGWVVLVRG